MSDNIKQMSDNIKELEEIEKWKMKKLIKFLSSVTGTSNTSMVTLALPPSKSLSYVNNMLVTEYGTASNIKSRVNRLSVLSAITSVQTKLKQYKSIPKTGLVIYCGNIILDDRKEKKVTYDITPFKSINKFIYLCDNKFHTDVLSDILNDDESYGFIILDGNGALYGTVYGNEQKILHKFDVSLPKKHRKGGQSALRFARLRMEARNNYIRKVAEFTTHYFIEDDKPNIKGLIIAGNSDFKNQLIKSQYFDPRLNKVILSILDISYGGQNGFNQALEMSLDIMANVKLVREKKILDEYFEEIKLDTGKYCFGIKETVDALEQGAVERLIIYEDLDLIKYKFIDSNKTTHIKYLKKEDSINLLDKNGCKMDIQESIDWTDWIAENYKQFGTELIFLTNRTQQGSQFVNGFGGIGCILRWQVQFMNELDILEELDINNDNRDHDFDDDIDAYL
tara:strand:- start:365 stop:1717 length:1353 start_codon:yes stop_codon:yes gene_type:complete